LYADLRSDLDWSWLLGYHENCGHRRIVCNSCLLFFMEGYQAFFSIWLDKQ
jgi:hypothetical protein